MIILNVLNFINGVMIYNSEKLYCYINGRSFSAFWKRHSYYFKNIHMFVSKKLIRKKKYGIYYYSYMNIALKNHWMLLIISLINITIQICQTLLYLSLKLLRNGCLRMTTDQRIYLKRRIRNSFSH